MRYHKMVVKIEEGNGDDLEFVQANAVVHNNLGDVYSGVVNMSSSSMRASSFMTVGFMKVEFSSILLVLVAIFQ